MRHLPLIHFAAVATLCAACGGADSVNGVGNTPKVSLDPTKIEAMIAALPDWVDNAPTPRATIVRPPVYLREAVGTDLLDYRCNVSGQNVVKVFPRIVAAVSNLSTLYPGALVEGASLASGQPSVISSVARAPITLRITVPIAKQSLKVSEVSGTTMAQAIADLQRAAADEQGTRDVIPANMKFELTEASTFDPSMTDIGVAVG